MISAEQAQMLASIFLNVLEDEFKTTKKILAAVPPGQLDFKLGDKGRTTRELMKHLAASEVWFAQGIISGSYGHGEEQVPAASTAELVTWYESQLPALTAKLKALTGEQLAKPINFFNIYNLPAVFYMSFWNNHSVHHRGQLSTYLRAMNAHVPSIYGGSADEPFAVPATA